MRQSIYLVLLSGCVVEGESSVSSPDTFLDIRDQRLQEAIEVFFVSHLLEVSTFLIADKQSHTVHRNIYTNILKICKKIKFHTFFSTCQMIELIHIDQNHYVQLLVLLLILDELRFLLCYMRINAILAKLQTS